MTFAVFCFMVLWVLLIIEGLNCEIIVLCSLVAILLAIIKKQISLFSYLKGKKTPSKLSFWERHFHSKKSSDCRILHLDFQNFYGGGGPDPPSQLAP